MIYVLDGSALIAFARDEPGAEVVERLLDSDDRCVAHAVNLCELFYDFHRERGEQAAQAVIQALLAATLVIHHDLDDAFWQEVGRIKSDHRRVSLADCFCLALAERVNGTVVTCDHHEFDALVSHAICPIRFIR